MASYKTLCLDFDGVLHAYTSGWKGIDVIEDGPVDGAMDFLARAVMRFDVAIYSSRSSEGAGREAMADAIVQWFLESGYSADETVSITSRIRYPVSKPAAWVTIDDRAITFDGDFPSLDEIDRFAPWYKKVDTRQAGK